MSEWQRARLVMYHNVPPEYRNRMSDQAIRETISKIVMVRPLEPSDQLLAHYRAVGCDAQKFYLIRAKDVASIACGLVCCEHECLTD
jgi:hypothetical protein